MQVKTGVKSFLRSKIVLLAVTGAFVFGGIWLRDAGVTTEQVVAVQNAAPQIQDAVEQYQTDRNLFALVGALGYIAIAIVRVWFTTSLTPQSIAAADPKKVVPLE